MVTHGLREKIGLIDFHFIGLSIWPSLLIQTYRKIRLIDIFTISFVACDSPSGILIYFFPTHRPLLSLPLLNPIDASVYPLFYIKGSRSSTVTSSNNFWDSNLYRDRIICQIMWPIKTRYNILGNRSRFFSM